MKKFVFWHTLPLLLIFAACPGEKIAALETKVELAQGIRHDHLKWRSSGKHEGVHAQTKVDLRSRHIYLTGLKASIAANDFIGCIDLSYGDVIRGKFRDSIRAEDSRHEISHMHAKIRGDYTVDSSAKIGYMFHLFRDAILTPSIGGAYFLQRYTLRDGDFTIRGGHPNYPDAPRLLESHYKMHGMHASSKAQTVSPFIDVRFKKPLLYSFELDLGYAFFYPMYFSNKFHFDHLHRGVKDKSRERNTYGQLGEVTLRYTLLRHFEIALGTVFSEFRGNGGTSRISEHGSSKERFRLKRVRRTTVDYLLSLAYSF